MAKSGVKMIWMTVAEGMMLMEITGIMSQVRVMDDCSAKYFSAKNVLETLSKLIFHTFFNAIVEHLIHLFVKQRELVDFGELIATTLALEAVKAKLAKRPVRVVEIVHLDHLVRQVEKSAIIRAKKIARKREIKEAGEVQQLNGFKHR